MVGTHSRGIWPFGFKKASAHQQAKLPLPHESLRLAWISIERTNAQFLNAGRRTRSDGRGYHEGAWPWKGMISRYGHRNGGSKGHAARRAFSGAQVVAGGTNMPVRKAELTLKEYRK
jgi:hypothetical protein